ncbi:MAG TPA: hypothetical protein VGR96_08740 [Acidobacteriaceae bacterium]|nr:hypothetical protein [Acidobacteriaceae bacterium]
MLKRTLTALSLGLAAGLLLAAGYPSTEISNGQIHVKIYLPAKDRGFYHSTRFDWSGVIGSLKYKDHDYYGAWWQKIDPNVYDFGYDGADVVSAPFTAGIGPMEEFQTDGGALGYNEAQPGGTFIKIGVGVLRKPDNSKYDHSKAYEIVDPGKWSVKRSANSVVFTQVLNDPGSHYGYIYQKTVRLIAGKPEMVLEHSLKNTGSLPIRSVVYDHNFLVLDKQPPGPDFSITFPFQLQAKRAPAKELGEIRGNQLAYLKTLEGHDRMTATLAGFSDQAKDYDIRVENHKVGAGVEITGDRPLTNVGYWSIKTVLAVEPYIGMEIQPGDTFTWKLTYDYYTLPPGK